MRRKDCNVSAADLLKRERKRAQAEQSRKERGRVKQRLACMVRSVWIF